VLGHKRVVSYGMLSCVPFEHFPLPYNLTKLAFLSLAKWDLEHLHNTNNAWCQQQPQVLSIEKHLAQNQMQLF
jgi:hypothetical protein